MMATQSLNSAFAQKVIRTNLSSLHTSLRVAQILSVTLGYSQKKKDSVQAVLIQLYTDYISLRGSVTNHPNSIGSVQRLPDDIGLLPVIQTINGVYMLNHGNNTQSIYIVGIQRLFNSFLMAAVFSLYSILSSSSSVINDSYFLVNPLDCNKLTEALMSFSLLSSAGKITLVLPVNNAPTCLQNVFAGQLQDIPTWPDISKISTSYTSFLLLLSACSLNVIATSSSGLSQNNHGYFFFCDFCLDSFISQASITQDEKLTVFLEQSIPFIANSISSINSCGKRIPLYCDLLFLCPVAIEIIQSKCFNTIKNTVNIFPMEVFKQKWLDVFKQIEVTYLNTLIINIKKKQNPVGAVNTNRVSNHNVKRGNTMAMYKSTQTHPKFKWRFFSCQQSRYFTVEARSEQEARSMLPDAPCLFSARFRQSLQNTAGVSA
ncbi:host cell division inhibitor Icd-like protein [Morganella morganii]|uniref:host cell division inhibitor Icd-like protein n=1 Tax=Morganella morganii TaxID=582 RepID=UPI003EB919C2